jgi:hypothetical protein
MHKILQYILNIFITKYSNNYLIKIQNSYSDQINICKNSGGDVRKIINYFELILNSTHSLENYNNPDCFDISEVKKEEISEVKKEEIFNTQITPVTKINIKMLKNKRLGPLYSLERIIRHDNNMNIKAILKELSNDSSLLYGIYTSYINYVPWVMKNNNLSFQKERCSKLWKNIAELFAIYGNLKDYEKNNQMWEFTDIANIISCWGLRCLIKEEINVVYDKNDKNKKTIPKFYSKSFWWVELEKGKRTGDEPIDIPICNKMLRGYLNNHILSNTSFKMIESGIGNSIAWKPKNIRGTLQILKLKKDNMLEQTHNSASKSNTSQDNTIFLKKLNKISDRLSNMVGII